MKVKKERGTFGSIWHGLKKTFGYGKFKDDKEQEHRDGFTILVRDLKAQLRPRMKALTIAVIPHVNSSSKFRLHFHFFTLLLLWLLKISHNMLWMDYYERIFLIKGGDIASLQSGEIKDLDGRYIGYDISIQMWRGNRDEKLIEIT